MRALFAAPPAWLLMALAAGVNLIWALTYPVSKLVMTEVSAGALSCWRLAGTVILLAPFLRRSEFPEKVTLRDVGLLSLMGLVGGAAAVVLQYLGTARSTASNVSVLVGTETMFAVLLAAIFLGERVGGRMVAGMAAAIAGVLLVSVDPATLDLLSSRYGLGNALMLASIFCYAVYTILGKVLGARWGPMALTVVPFVLASAVTVPYYALTEPAAMVRGLMLTWQEGLGVLLIVGVGTALCYVCWNWLLRWMSASRLSYSLYLQPVAGALFSAWMLGEALTPTFMAGAGLILVAMALGAEGDAKPAALEKGPEALAG